TLLIEGWADVHAGVPTRQRCIWAIESRDLWRGRGGTGAYLRELTGPAGIHRFDGPGYNAGGAFADFLLRRSGMRRFLGLYWAGRPKTSEADCEEHLGVTLEALETDFWKWAEQQAKQPDGRRPVGPLELSILEACEEATRRRHEMLPLLAAALGVAPG